MKEYFISISYVVLYLVISALLLVDPNEITFNTVFVGLTFSFLIGIIVGADQDLFSNIRLGNKPLIMFFLLGPVFYSLFSTLLHPGEILRNPILVSLVIVLSGFIINRKKINYKYIASSVIFSLIFLYTYLGLYWND